ncbi:hypothetical protein HUA74_22725 [Myxococcus sp. CA051A]|uniref:hypothetical protein n=1 Tax=unclassified Myxococcus TaxID=2648731 RepID=UPI00157A657D|nr:MULTISPECIES: hypothetical protein [unclassified Myxococcus]NTX17654.1 hypothetical protein [Myxococcus sp. CA056]NTX63472.1 hypothetical protein [Myxococcus sp. CA051A]
MSRIDASGGTSLPLDTLADAVPTPSLPRTPTAQARNEVSAYDGPSSRASPRGAEPSPGVAGPTVSAGALAALGGRLRAPSAEVPSDVSSELQARLTRGLGDWAVSDTDVKTVHTLLGQLPPAAYRATLDWMEREGLLKTFLTEQDPGARESFLKQAEAKGVLQRLAGEPASGPLGYPGKPEFLRNDAALPESLRHAVSEHAVAAGRAFHAAHAAYLGRYAQAVEDAPGLPELRKLGAPRDARLPDSVLGLDRRDPEREAYAKQWRLAVGAPTSTNWVYQAINARQRALLGERTGGTLALKGKAELTQGNLKLGGEAQVDSRGKVDLKGLSGVELKGGPVGLKVTQDTKGGFQSEMKLDLGLVKVSQVSDGELKVSLGVGKLAGSYTTLNLKEARFGGGVFAQVEEAGNKAEVRLGFDMKGLTAQRAKEAVDRQHVGLFDEPPELGRGQSWDALPESKRERYVRNGWNREEWTRAQGA